METLSQSLTYYLTWLLSGHILLILHQSASAATVRARAFTSAFESWEFHFCARQGRERLLLGRPFCNSHGILQFTRCFSFQRGGREQAIVTMSPDDGFPDDVTSRGFLQSMWTSNIALVICHVHFKFSLFHYQRGKKEKRKCFFSVT